MASPSSTVSGGDGDTPPVSSSNTPVAVSGTTSVGAVSGSTAVAVSGTASGFTAVAISGTTSGSTAVAVSGSIAAASGTTASAAPAPAPAPPQAPAPAPPQAPSPLQHRKAPADPKPGSRARLSRALEKVTLDNIKEANAGIKRARKTEAKREENFKKQKHDDNMSEDEGDYPDSHTDTSDAGSSD